MALSIEEKRELFEEFKKELMKSQTVYVETCRDGVELPQYAHIGDAGMDIRAAQDTIILPGDTKIVPTGLKMAIPQGYELQVVPRSGLSLKTPLRIANTPRTIDSGYRDEIGIVVSNTSWMAPYDIRESECTGITCSFPEHKFYSRYAYVKLAKQPFGVNEILKFKLNLEPYTIDEKGNKLGIYKINAGDRIAQIILIKYETIDFVPVEDVKKVGLNRGGGFGSTGTK